MRAIPLRAARRLLPILISSSVMSSTLSAHAAPAKNAKARAQASLEEVAVMLSSSDEDEVRTALETAATLPPSEILPMLDERVRSGLPRVLLDVAIDSLMLLADKSSAPLLNDLARHRRPEVRGRALEALGRLKPADAEQTLTHALGDPVPEVRSAAARALGELGSRSSLPALTRALERDVDGASRALGQLAKSEDLNGLLEQVGRAPTASLTPMFAALLARRELPEVDKLRCVERLAALGGEEATEALEALLAQLPADGSPRVRKALEQALAQGKSQ